MYESRVEEELLEGFVCCISRLGVACFQNMEWIEKKKKKKELQSKNSRAPML